MEELRLREVSDLPRVTQKTKGRCQGNPPSLSLSLPTCTCPSAVREGEAGVRWVLDRHLQEAGVGGSTARVRGESPIAPRGPPDPILLAEGVEGAGRQRGACTVGGWGDDPQERAPPGAWCFPHPWGFVAPAQPSPSPAAASLAPAQPAGARPHSVCSSAVRRAGCFTVGGFWPHSRSHGSWTEASQHLLQFWGPNDNPPPL